MKAIDVSSHQPRDLTAIIAEYDPQLVIVKLYLPWESIAQAHTIAQLESAKAHGKLIGGYVWGYLVSDPRRTILEACVLSRRHGNPLPAVPQHAGGILWLDCETYTVNGVVEDRGPDAEWIRVAREEAKSQGCVLGIYTGQWWWDAYMEGTTEFGDMPLWSANYTGTNPDVKSLPEFGGWTHESGMIIGRQYRGSPIDLNTFLDMAPEVSKQEHITNAISVLNGWNARLVEITKELQQATKELEDAEQTFRRHAL